MPLTLILRGIGGQLPKDFRGCSSRRLFKVKNISKMINKFFLFSEFVFVQSLLIGFLIQCRMLFISYVVLNDLRVMAALLKMM